MNSEIRILAQQLLHAGPDQLPARERRIIARVARRMHTRDLNKVFEERLTFGQRLSDRVAMIGGSWEFIAGFGLFLAAWAVINGVVLVGHAIDPYPFIFLNLLLSMLAAVQAPIIMMSQNRQVAKDRMAAALDYEVNLKTEIAIAELHAKMDRLQERLERGDVLRAQAPAREEPAPAA